MLICMARLRNTSNALTLRKSIQRTNTSSGLSENWSVTLGDFSPYLWTHVLGLDLLESCYFATTCMLCVIGPSSHCGRAICIQECEVDSNSRDAAQVLFSILCVLGAGWTRAGKIGRSWRTVGWISAQSRRVARTSKLGFTTARAHQGIDKVVK